MSDFGEIKASEVSEFFNAPDSDVTIQSSDGILFKVYKKYLEFATGAFPPAEMETRGEIVVLTEPAAILEPLFQIMYPQRNPDLGSMGFDTLLVLAEAAEKYEVYGAINVCMLWMARALPAHVAEIFAYAARHRYDSVLDQVAPLALALPHDEVAKLLPQNMLLPWICYYSKACRVLFDAMANINRESDWGQYGISQVRSSQYCTAWRTDTSRKLLIKLAKGPGVLLELNNLASAMLRQEGGTCTKGLCTCALYPSEWEKWVQSEFDGIGKLSAYIL